MRSKTILSIAAFIVAFAFSTAFAGLFIAKSAYQSVLTVPANQNRQSTSCFTKRGRYTADKIEVFISQDVSNGRERDRKLYEIDRDYRPSFMSKSFSDYSAVISEYVDESNALDETALPQEFQNAWRAHLKAWRDYANFLETIKTSSDSEKLNGKAAYELESHFNAEINSTWYEVLRVGGTYGAEVD